MGKRRKKSHDLPLRRFDALCQNLFLLRRELLTRPATEREIGLIAEWEYERRALRNAWPAIAFGSDKPTPRNVTKGSPSTKSDETQAKSVKKKSQSVQKNSSSKYVHDPTAFRRDKPLRSSGREIYATGRITVVRGGLPETRRR